MGWTLLHRMLAAHLTLGHICTPGWRESSCSGTLGRSIGSSDIRAHDLLVVDPAPPSITNPPSRGRPTHFLSRSLSLNEHPSEELCASPLYLEDGGRQDCEITTGL
jgi:hypothetical protein